MTKLVIISGISGDKFEDGVSQPVLALKGEQGYGVLGIADASDEDLLAKVKAEIAETESELPPEELWGFFFQGAVQHGGELLIDTTEREVYDFAA